MGTRADDEDYGYYLSWVQISKILMKVGRQARKRLNPYL
jgi:hypothetical protein